MKLNRTRKESIAILKDYCSRLKLFGIYNHMFFESLKNAYPLEFYYFTQFTGKYRESRKSALEKVKINISNKIDLILKQPLEQSDIDQLNKVINKIEDIYFIKLQKLNN